MVLNIRRIFYKYAKCLVITVLTIFFAQLLISVNYFPSIHDNNLLQRNSHSSLQSHILADVSARKVNPGNSDDEDLPQRNYQNKAAPQLRKEELDFIPICEVKSREAISAIHRAKSQYCKQLIINKTCLIQDGSFYPQELNNYCTSKSNVYGRDIGCYMDEKKLRLLSSFYGNYANQNSPKFCLDICVQAGFPYAGVQYG